MRRRAWLKSLHILCAALWLGSGMGMLVLMLADSQDVGTLHAIWVRVRLIDVALVAIPNGLTFLTGLLLCTLAGWGLRHTWIHVKLLANLGVALFGGSVMRHWVDRVLQLLSTGDPGVLQDPVFLSTRHSLIVWTLAIEAVLIGLVFISVFKPWRQLARGSATRTPAAARRPAPGPAEPSSRRATS